MIREEGYEWLVKVTGGCVWVPIGVCGCIDVWEHENQAHKDKYGSHAHDFPVTMTGKFPEIHVWVRGDTEGHTRSFMLTDKFATMYLGMVGNPMHTKGHVGTLGRLGIWILARMSRREKSQKAKQNNCVHCVCMDTEGHVCVREGLQRYISVFY